MDELDKLLLEVVSEIHQQPKQPSAASLESSSLSGSVNSLQEALGSSGSRKHAGDPNATLMARNAAGKTLVRSRDVPDSHLDSEHSMDRINTKSSLVLVSRTNLTHAGTSSTSQTQLYTTRSQPQLALNHRPHDTQHHSSFTNLNSHSNPSNRPKSKLGKQAANQDDETKPICETCAQPIQSGPIMKALGKHYHPEHFRCQGVIAVKKQAGAPFGPFSGSKAFGTTSRHTNGRNQNSFRPNTASSSITPCNRPLALTAYFEKDGLILCERCYINMTCERCAYCEEIIEDRCVKALGKSFHPDHFFCGQCGKIFDTKNGAGFMEYNGKAYCEEDYAALFAKHCSGCKKPLIDDYLVAVGELWHQGCFGCADCKKIFQANESFFELDGSALCEQHYYARQSFICHACNKPIVGRCISALGKRYHEDHFTCSYCQLNLDPELNDDGRVGFKSRDGKPYCLHCHLKLFA